MIAFRLVPRGVDFSCSVYLCVLGTFLARLVLLGQLLYSTDKVYIFFHPQLNRMKLNEVQEEQDEYGIWHEGNDYDELGNKLEWNEYDESEIKHVKDPGYCSELTIIEEGGSFLDPNYGGSVTNIYVKCERQNPEELMSQHFENKYEFPGVLYCREDERTMIYVENDLVDKEVKIWEVLKDPGVAEDAVKEFGGGAWSWLEPKYIYCGDISSDLAITSRVVGGMLWLAICFLPFLILTLLHNYSDLKFLMKNPDVLLFGNISHFQVGPTMNCWNENGDRVRCYKVTNLSFFNILISAVGAGFLSYVCIGYFDSRSIMWTTVFGIPFSMGLAGSVRFLCLPACFPAVPVYTAEDSQFQYLQDGVLLGPGHPDLEIKVRRRGLEMSIQMPAI